MKKIILILLISHIFSQNIITGYLRTIEVSFCMDDCSLYYIEQETIGSEPINIIFLDTFNSFDYYIDRFVDIEVGNLIDCIESGRLVNGPIVSEFSNDDWLKLHNDYFFPL